MFRKGDCWDVAIAESFVSGQKKESIENEDLQ